LSGKKIPDLSPVPAGTPASQLFLETARQISPSVWAGESEQIGVSDFVALLAAAGAALSVNITSLLNDRGSYAPSSTYTRYDFVAYGGGHYVYINATPSSGNVPPNISYWTLISVDGKSAIATITDATPAAIPAVGAQATYGVDSSAGMVIGQIIGIGAASTLSVSAIPTTASITVQNIDAVVGPVATGAKIAAAGKKGTPGLDSTVPGPAGANAFTTVTTQFTIPAFNAQVTAAVGSTAFMSAGMALQIGGVFFRVAAAPTNTTTVSLTNSVNGQTGTIAATSKVVVSGEAGPAGPSGASGVNGLQYAYLNTAGAASAGQIRSTDINAVGSSTVSISATDAQATPKSTADVLARLKVGAIIEIAASNANKVRGTITADYASGTNSFDWAGQIVSGAIANNATVYLSIISDPVSSSGGGGTVVTVGTNPQIPAIGSSDTFAFNSTADLLAQQYYGFDTIGGALIVLSKPSATTVVLQNISAIATTPVPAGTKLGTVGKPGTGGGGGSSGGTITATAAGNNIQLSEATPVSAFSWLPVKYDFYRSTTNNFTLAQATAIATDRIPTDYLDSGLTPATYYYRRVAKGQLGEIAISPMVSAVATSGSANLFEDNFTGANGTALTGRQPDTAGTNLYTDVPNRTGFEIQNNTATAIQTANSEAINQYDIGAAFTSVYFKLNANSTASNSVGIFIAYNSGGDFTRVRLTNGSLTIAQDGFDRGEVAFSTPQTDMVWEITKIGTLSNPLLRIKIDGVVVLTSNPMATINGNVIRIFTHPAFINTLKKLVIN
jgi:hypothetical protein